MNTPIYPQTHPHRHRIEPSDPFTNHTDPPQHTDTNESNRRRLFNHTTAHRWRRT